MSDGWLETDEVREGVRLKVHRSVIVWDSGEAQTTVYARFWADSLPHDAAGCAALFASFPPAANVTGSVGYDENPGEISIDWTEDATDEDRSGHAAKQEAKRAEAERQAAFDAWWAEEQRRTKAAATSPPGAPT